MHFPQYWAKGTKDDISVWRWSDQSKEDAVRLAEQVSAAIALKVQQGVPKSKEYEYGDRPLREEIIRDLQNIPSTALVSRNSYGCLVLNTARIMFIDIDFDAEAANPSGRQAGWLSTIFSKKSAATVNPDSDDSKVLHRLEDFLRLKHQWGFRVYRTAAGFRVLATHALFDPLEAESQHALESLGADPLYARLCRNQKSYRARLSPKPWRCGLSNPGVRWPFEAKAEESEFRKWLLEYEKQSAQFATCKFICARGNSSIPTEIQALIAVHDKETRCDSSQPLA